MLIKLTNLLDEAKCYDVIRQLRWPDGVVCLHCCGTEVVRNGHDDRERHRSGIPSFLGMGEVDPDVWHPKYRSTEAAM